MSLEIFKCIRQYLTPLAACILLNGQPVHAVNCPQLLLQIYTHARNFAGKETEISQPLSTIQSRILANNIELLGVKPDTGKRYYFGNRQVWSFLFYHGIQVAAAQSEVHRELARLLLVPYRNKRDLLNKLSDWSGRYNLGWQFAFDDEIKQRGKELKQTGRIAVPDEKFILDYNKYIHPELYVQLLEKNVYSIADPHDLLFHLSSLTNPTFSKYLKDFSKLAMELSAKMDNQQSAYFESNKGSDPKLLAIPLLYKHLTGTLRDYTHENWSYLVQSADNGWNLFLQGNMPFNGIISDLTLNRPYIFSSDIFFNRKVKSNYGSLEISSLPSLEEFTKDPGRNQLYLNYSVLLAKHGADPSTLNRFRAKLDAFLMDAPELTGLEQHSANESLEQRLTRAGAIMKKLAAFIAQDQELAYALNLDSKLELFDAANAFIIAYANWIEKS